MFKIIGLSRSNINQITQVDFECEHQLERKRKFESYKKELIERFNKKQEMFFGFVEGRELKGYVTLKPFFPGHKHCEAYWIAVKKKYQSRGIGKELMRFIENYAKKKGFRKIFLYTNEKMKGVRRFYENLGYKLINKFPGYYGFPKDNTAVLYGKTIGKMCDRVRFP
jgi:ribosomal protein S18 acetylase RimI-like enzyme